MTENDLKYWKQALNGVIPKELITPEVVALRDQQNKMLNLMTKKNADYGNAFNLGCSDLGIKYGLARIYDKAKRAIKLIGDEFNGYNNPNVEDESMLDTIQDLGNYCNMILAWKALDEDEVHIPSTGQDADKYYPIGDKLGYDSIAINVKDKDVTSEILEDYGADNLYMNNNAYLYNISKDGMYVSVTDRQQNLVVVMSKSQFKELYKKK